MNEKELRKIQELRSRGYVPVGPGIKNADWDEEMAPGADDPRLIREREEMILRARNRKPAAANVEALQRLVEENKNNARHHEALFVHQAEGETFVQGRVLHINQFLKLLRKIRPDATYNDFCLMGLRGINFRDTNSSPLYFGTTVQSNYMPEWSQFRLDHRGHVVGERFRGWRTALMSLILKDVVTEKEAIAVFGKAKGPRKAWWGRKLFAKRNNLCVECERHYCVCKDRYESMRSDNYSRLPDVQDYLKSLRKK